MAAVRSMMAVAREEAAIITTEIAATARTSVIETTRTVELELNPIAVRQAVKTSVKEGAAGGEYSLSFLAIKTCSSTMTRYCHHCGVKLILRIPPHIPLGSRPSCPQHYLPFRCSP